MKKYLLPNTLNSYKANLHMHTIVSDGRMTPLETKEAFLKEGYSIVAFTDHEVMIPHPELIDDNFLAITSTEISIDEDKDLYFPFRKVYHLNIYSKDPNKRIFKGYDSNTIWINHTFDYLKDEEKTITRKREYTKEFINKIIEEANNDDCFVSLNHPVWSMQNHDDYSGLKGLWGVEWFNTGCVHSGYYDTIQPLDDLLNEGEKVFPLATDDAHSLNDCFGGYVVVRANNLKYDEVYEALKNGDFYSSTKPEIKEISIDNGVVCIKSSKARQVFITTERRYTHSKRGTIENPIEEVYFDINNYIKENKEHSNKPMFIRITVIDFEGNIAYSRPYFMNELEED